MYIVISKTVLCWSQPIKNQCCCWTGYRGSYYNYKMPFSKYHQETLKKKKYIIQILVYYTAQLGPHSKVVGRRSKKRGERGKRGREKIQAWI